MRPFPNKVTIPLLMLVVGILLYFLFALYTVETGIALVVGPIYPLYVMIAALSVLAFILILSALARYRWEAKAGTARQP